MPDIKRNEYDECFARRAAVAAHRVLHSDPDDLISWIIELQNSFDDLRGQVIAMRHDAESSRRETAAAFGQLQEAYDYIDNLDGRPKDNDYCE